MHAPSGAARVTDMHPAVRAALDRVMYEQAVVLHMLRLAPSEACGREVPGMGATVARVLTDLAAALDDLAASLEPGNTAGAPQPAEPPDGESAIELSRQALRRLFSAATALPEGGVEPGRLQRLWEAAALYSRAREPLLAALPESADDPVVRRWRRAPEPPADASVDGPASCE
ncbi:MAG: hypothetical protein KatS3mg062_0281 [Tepidiforma sp.]|nr:MAG: hypothetical protein KatS3mg062_0281 [Tepidiforma sp.]